MSMFVEGDRVIVKPGQPGRFARYGRMVAVVAKVSPNGRTLELWWEGGPQFGSNRDWLGPEHVKLAPE